MAKRTQTKDIPGGPVVDRLAANARIMGSTPGPGRSHMLRGNKARAPQLLKPMSPRAGAPQQEEPRQRESRTQQTESSPHSPHLEKAHEAPKAQSGHK